MTCVALPPRNPVSWRPVSLLLRECIVAPAPFGNNPLIGVEAYRFRRKRRPALSGAGFTG